MTLVLGEVGARVWVAMRWQKDRIALLTTHSTERGRFACHPNLPFALNPAWPDHNEFGCRGPAIAQKKPQGVQRVACIGASTTYGLFVSAADAYPSQLAKLLSAKHGPWEGINAGVPGYVSTETLTNFLLRILPLEPDVVVVLLGRNEIFPETYNGFRDDYSHFRRAGFNYTVSNYWHKELFRISHLAMLVCTLGGERFGWSERAEHPLYGGIVWENQPTPAQVAVHVGDASRLATLERSFASILAVCQARGIEVVVCTMAFLPQNFQKCELEPGPQMQTLLDQLIDKNNEVARAVARRFGVPVVEGAKLRERPDLFHDDCHMVAEGYRLRAQMVFDTLSPRLSARR